MTQDRTPQRAVDVDAPGWSPFVEPVHGTEEEDETVDARASTVHADAAGWHPVVIEGGRGHEDAPELDATVDEGAAPVAVEDGPAVDVLDAAAADVLAIFADAPPIPVVTQPESAPEPVEPDSEPAPEPAPEPVAEAPAPAPEVAPQAPVAPAQEATPHPALHTPTQATTEAPAPAQETVEAAATPHSTPRWRTAVGWLNLYDILDQPLPPVREIYQTAWSSVDGRHGFDRATEVAFVCGIGVPLSIAARVVDTAGHSKWRLLGVAVTASLWTVAVLTAPVDASTLGWWTLAGYWLSTVTVIPAVIKATE